MRKHKNGSTIEKNIKIHYKGPTLRTQKRAMYLNLSSDSEISGASGDFVAGLRLYFWPV